MIPTNANWIAAALPLYASIPSVFVFLALLGLLLIKPISPATRYLLLAIWLRYVLSAFPVITVARSPAGLTWNALASLMIIGIGAFTVKSKIIFDRKIWFILVFIAFATMSGVANKNILTGIDEILKYVYLIFIIGAFVQAAQDTGFERLLDYILWLFVVPCALQMETIALGVAKAGESDGSKSYIGGYGHESAFSIVVLTGLFVVCLQPRMSLIKRMALIALFSISILLANYRTTMLAAGPFLLVAILTSISAKFVVKQRKTVISAMVGAMCLGSVVVLPLAADRFDTLAVALSEGTNLIKPIDSFTPADREVLSGRAFLWSEYYYAWKDSTAAQHYIGSGPGAWEDILPLYAHNTLVSTLFETGIVGVILMLAMWISMLVTAVQISAPIRPTLIAAHIGFFILNMATMPFWQVEGLVLYALICGATLYWYQRNEPEAATARHLSVMAYS